jgi:hypothetical protein
MYVCTACMHVCIFIYVCMYVRVSHLPSTNYATYAVQYGTIFLFIFSIECYYVLRLFLWIYVNYFSIELYPVAPYKEDPVWFICGRK